MIDEPPNLNRSSDFFRLNLPLLSYVIYIKRPYRCKVQSMPSREWRGLSRTLEACCSGGQVNFLETPFLNLRIQVRRGCAATVLRRPVCLPRNNETCCP